MFFYSVDDRSFLLRWSLMQTHTHTRTPPIRFIRRSIFSDLLLDKKRQIIGVYLPCSDELHTHTHTDLLCFRW